MHGNASDRKLLKFCRGNNSVLAGDISQYLPARNHDQARPKQPRAGQESQLRIRLRRYYRQSARRACTAPHPCAKADVAARGKSANTTARQSSETSARSQSLVRLESGSWRVVSPSTIIKS